MKKKQIIIGSVITVAVLVLAVAAVFLLKPIENKPLYGEFTCKTKDGETATIILTENTVYCENLNYEGAEGNAALSLFLDLKRETGLKYTTEEMEKIIDGFKLGMDFKSVFDKKTSSITETEAVEDINCYNYTIADPQDDTLLLCMMVDANEKKLYCSSMTFNYTGKTK